MANPEVKREFDSEEETEVKKVSVESKQKSASEKFLNFMKKTREDEQKKEEAKAQKSSAKQESSIDVSSFVINLSRSLSKLINKVNMWIDVMLASSQRIRVLSLFMALILCYFINGGSGIATTKSIDYIDNVPVTVFCGEEYEMTGHQDTVTVQLIGDYASIQWAKVMKNYSVILNAEDKSSGNYELSYRADGFSSGLDVKVIPETAKVNISKKMTKSFALEYSFTNKTELDPAYTLKEPQLAFLEVDVTAGETTLDKIDRVVARIDVGGLTESVRDQEAPIVALDSMGNELDVKIAQSTVLYDLDVVSFSKVVPVKLETKGDVDSKYYLNKLIPSVSSVTIYGQEADLENINEITAAVNIAGLNANTEISGVALNVPEAVKKISDKTISVKIEVEEKIDKTINNIPITLESTPSGLNARLISTTKVSLRVSGPKSKIDALDASSLKVYIDLSGASAGTASYELKIADQDPAIDYEWTGASSADVAITEN